MVACDVERADGTRFQSWLREHQYPADCRAVPGVLTRAGRRLDGKSNWAGDYFYGLGLGSQMASLKYNFVDSLVKGRVYHFPTTHYANPVRCASQRFDCYFEAPTNCTITNSATSSRSAHRKMDTAPLLWCFELPRRRLSRLAGLKAVHAEAWYHGQLSSFLFRPNAAMRAFRAEIAPRFDYNINHTRAAIAERVQPGLLHNGSSCVAMHIRRSDKFKGRRREDPRSALGFAQFGHAYKSWAFWNANRPTSQLRVLLGSEDPASFNAMPPLLAPSVGYWIPGRYFVMANFHDIVSNNNKLVGRYAALLAKMAAAQAEGAAAVAALEASGVRKDEGMALIVQILLMAECQAFFGSYASNVAILVHDLMHALRVAQCEHRNAIDVNGRAYCACGASFCMKLERRAAREPRRPIRHMVEAFRGSNVNAI